MFYTYCSSSYVHWLYILIRSIRRVHPTIPILVHFIEEVDGHIKLLKHSDPYLKIESAIIKPDSRWQDKSLSREQRGAIFLEARLKDTLEASKQEDFDTMIVMDTDLLVRKPLEGIINPMRLFDFGAVIRGKATCKPLPAHLETSAALYSLRKSGIQVLEQIVSIASTSTKIRGISRGDWFWDQACHTEAVFQTSAKVYTICRERYLSSRPFEHDSAIWNGNFRATQGKAAYTFFEKELATLDPLGITAKTLDFKIDIDKSLIVK